MKVFTIIALISVGVETGSLANASGVSPRAKDYDIAKMGVYTGHTDSGEDCSLEVQKIRKSFFIGSLKQVSAEVSFMNETVSGLAMKCKNHMEEGFYCYTSQDSGDLMLVPYARRGYGRENDSEILKPYFLYTSSGGDEVSCYDLEVAN